MGNSRSYHSIQSDAAMDQDISTMTSEEASLEDELETVNLKSKWSNRFKLMRQTLKSKLYRYRIQEHGLADAAPLNLPLVAPKDTDAGEWAICGWRLGVSIGVFLIVFCLALWVLSAEMGWSKTAVSWTTSQVSWTTSQVNLTTAWVQLEVKNATRWVQSEAEELRVRMNNGTDDADGEELELPEPSWAGYAVSASVVLASVCCAGSCFYLSMSDLRIRAPPCFGVHSEDRAQQSNLAPTLLGELALGIVQPLLVCPVALCAAMWSGGGKVPVWAQVVLPGLPVLRSIIADASLMRSRRAFKVPKVMEPTFKDPEDMDPADMDSEDPDYEDTRPDIVPTWFQLVKSFCKSKAEVFDGGTDGCSVAVVWLLERDPHFRQRLLAGWAHGPASLLLPAIECLGLAGVMALALAVASGAQFCTGAMMTDSGGEELSKMVGLGGLAVLLPKPYDEMDKVIDACFRIASKLLIEAAPQLLLQGSSIMAQGEGLAGSPSLALSVGVSAAMGAAAAVELTILGAKLARDAATRKDLLEFSHAMFLFFGGGLVSLAIVLAGVGRIFIAELCESKMWGPTTGCVGAPPAH
mmetsp:Transcript_39432/g.125184  ORF Transcript_39432/g.125184 Transcript_39432/m.125184 type:complete len:580 (+) Transcript_39432:125-1864(+)